MFYQPDSTLWLLPSDVGLEHDEFTLPLFEGESIHGWVVRPKDGLRLGTVIHFHGNAQNMTSHLGFSHWLAHKGFELVVFDYRGYGASRGVATRHGTVSDGVLVLRHFGVKLQRENLYVFGQSLGGAVGVSALALSQLPKVNAVILESTFASYRRLAQKKLASLALTWLFQLPLSYLITDDYAPVDHLQELSHLPLLQFHGTSDPVVPYEQGKELFKRFVQTGAAGVERRFETLDDAGHTPVYLGEEEGFKSLTLEFMCRYHSNPKKCVETTARRPIRLPPRRDRAELE